MLCRCVMPTAFVPLVKAAHTLLHVGDHIRHRAEMMLCPSRPMFMLGAMTIIRPTLMTAHLRGVLTLGARAGRHRPLGPAAWLHALGA